MIIDKEQSVTAMSGRPVIPIAGSHNLRDMGGYETLDGRLVGWGRLYRSGVMSRLTEADRVEFRRLGVVAIYDLRAINERSQSPTDWHLEADTCYFCRDYETSIGALDRIISKGNFDRQEFLQMIHTAYRELPFEQADAYREMFGLLVAGRIPLLFNCTAGKDRTGIAAALILHALGVPRQTIDHDYSLTELAQDKLEAILFGDSRYAPLARLPREQYLPMLRADPQYLTVAFQEIERRLGSVANYLESILGVGPREIEVLRENLL
jgi:protein-tyrosine phosphatase